MNHTDRTQALTNITTLTHWLAPRLNQLIDEAHRQAEAHATIRTGTGNRAPTGSHSDPTGQAVITKADAINQTKQLTQQIDQELRAAHTSLTWLLHQCEAIQRAGLRPADEPPTQPKRINCRSCARHGLDTDIAHGRYTTWCRRCGDFRTANGCLPSEEICRGWDRTGERFTVTPRMIIEAKARIRQKRRGA